MQGAMDFMTLFDAFIGVYLTYYAIRGEGKLFEGDYPKEMQEENKKILRIFCWVIGPPMIVFSVLEYIYGFGTIWSTISIIYVLAGVVGYVIVFYKKFGHILHPKKDSKKGKPAKKKK